MHKYGGGQGASSAYSNDFKHPYYSQHPVLQFRIQCRATKHEEQAAVWRKVTGQHHLLPKPLKSGSIVAQCSFLFGYHLLLLNVQFSQVDESELTAALQSLNLDSRQFVNFLCAYWPYHWFIFPIYRLPSRATSRAGSGSRSPALGSSNIKAGKG